MNTEYLYNTELEDKSIQIFYYEKMKNSMYYVVSYLNESLNKLNNVHTLNNDLLFDEYNSINFNDVSNEILNRIEYLNYTVIPAIQQKIDSLK